MEEGWMDGRRMDEWKKDGWMDGWMNGRRMDGWKKDGWMGERWMDGWMDGWMDRWREGRMDEKKE